MDNNIVSPFLTHGVHGQLHNKYHIVKLNLQNNQEPPQTNSPKCYLWHYTNHETQFPWVLSKKFRK